MTTPAMSSLLPDQRPYSEVKTGLRLNKLDLPDEEEEEGDDQLDVWELLRKESVVKLVDLTKGFRGSAEGYTGRSGALDRLGGWTLLVTGSRWERKEGSVCA